MRKFVGLPLAVVGGVVICLSAVYLLAPKQARGNTIFGYDPIYAGLGGVAALTGGLLLRNE